MTNIALDIAQSLLDVTTFLNMESLAVVDQVCVLDPTLRARFWEEAAVAALQKFPLRNAHVREFLQQGKEHRATSSQHARGLQWARRTISDVEEWKPWITKLSFCSLKFVPCELHAHSHGGTEQIRYPAFVPMSLGAYRGQSFVVSMTITPEAMTTEDQLDDSICIGVEGCGSSRSTRLMLAPCSGQCFHELAPGGPTLKASALKPLKCMPALLRIWMQVFESGCIRFLRQVEDHEPEDAGLLQSASLPRWIDQYFAFSYFGVPKRNASAIVSVDHASDSVPSLLADISPIDMDIVWECVDTDEF